MTLLFLLWLLLVPVKHGDREGREVALTFDACPTRGDGYDEALVEALLQEKIPATVFMSGRWASAHPERAAQLAKHFEIGNHGHVHDDARQETLTYEEALEDIRLAQEAIREATGTTPRLYRPPAVRYNDEVLRAAKNLGLTTILYDVASGDPDPNLSEDGIVKYVLWKAKPGSIVIFHVNGRGHTSAATVPRIAAGLRRKGYGLVTVGELLGP
jgi:peptidoglycan/xylan/chitin deacetylase (PgdA/CDA1 family)